MLRQLRWAAWAFFLVKHILVNDIFVNCYIFMTCHKSWLEKNLCFLKMFFLIENFNLKCVKNAIRHVSALCGENYDFFVKNSLFSQKKYDFCSLRIRCSQKISFSFSKIHFFSQKLRFVQPKIAKFRFLVKISRQNFLVKFLAKISIIHQLF